MLVLNSCIWSWGCIGACIEASEGPSQKRYQGEIKWKYASSPPPPAPQLTSVDLSWTHQCHLNPARLCGIFFVFFCIQLLHE